MSYKNFLAIAMIATVLTGCGQSGTSTSTDGSANNSSEETTTVTTETTTETTTEPESLDTHKDGPPVDESQASEKRTKKK